MAFQQCHESRCVAIDGSQISRVAFSYCDMKAAEYEKATREICVVAAIVRAAVDCGAAY